MEPRGEEVASCDRRAEFCAVFGGRGNDRVVVRYDVETVHEVDALQLRCDSANSTCETNVHKVIACGIINGILIVADLRKIVGSAIGFKLD